MSGRWRVLFHPRAERALAEIYVEAADRGAVADAAEELERQLERSPHAAGESRQPSPEGGEDPDVDRRVVFAGPLVARVVVHAKERAVIVTRLACARPGPTERRD